MPSSLLTNYFRDYVHGYHNKSNRLQQLCNNWKTPTEEDKKDFETLKTAIKNAQRLHVPREDLVVYLHTDSSEVGIGGYCFQICPESGKELPLRFISKRYSETARRWNTTEQEAFGIYQSIAACADLLLGRTFILRTDHRALVYMDDSMKKKVMRWRIGLLDFHFVVEHIAERANVIADFLSRNIKHHPMVAAFAIDEQPEEVLLVEPTAPITLNETKKVDEVFDDHPIMDVLRRRLQSQANAEQELADVLPEREDGEVDETFSDLLKPTDAALQSIKDTDDYTREQIIEMIQTVHNKDIGHGGFSRTFDLLSQNGKTWPSMRHHIRDYIIACPVCQKTSRLYKELPSEAHHLWSSKAFTVLQMDVIKNVTTNKRFKHILVLVDCFSRYVVLYPLMTETANEIIRCLGNFYGHYGRPRVIVSDGAPGFKANITKAFSTYFGYRISITDPYRPTAHGIVERTNQEVQRHLRALDLESEREWVELLPFIQHILNHSVSTVTGYPPSVIIFGRRTLAAELLADLDTESENGTRMHPAEIEQLNYDEALTYVGELDARLARIRERSNQHLDKVLLEKIDSTTPTEGRLTAGQLVLYKPDETANKTRKKLAPLWHGPAEVSKKEGDRLKLIDRTTGREFSRMVDQVKIFIPGKEPELSDLLNAKDTDDDVVVGVASHYPLKVKKKTNKSDIFFDMKIRTRDNRTVIKHLPYALVKHLKVVQDYLWSITALNHLVPKEVKTRTSKKNVSTTAVV